MDAEKVTIRNRGSWCEENGIQASNRTAFDDFDDLEYWYSGQMPTKPGRITRKLCPECRHQALRIEAGRDSIVDFVHGEAG